MSYNNLDEFEKVGPDWGNVLDGYGNPMTFELDWSDGQTLKVSSEEKIYFECSMEIPLTPDIQIKTMAVSTGWGSEGNWVITFLE